MANELRCVYSKTGATVTAKAFYDNAGTMAQRTGTASLTEDVTGIYGGDASGITGLVNDDTVVYYDGTAIIASETYDDGSPAQVDLIDAPNSTAIAVMQSGLSTHTAANVATEIFDFTGITAGGDWSFEKVLKVLAAWTAGNWRLKVGDSTKQQLIDPDDQATVILEQQLTRSPDSGETYRSIEVLI